MPATQAPFVIVNPAAGNGRTRRLVPWLSSRLVEAGHGAELAVTREPGHAVELARHAAMNGHDRVVAVGGDGTVQEVINGLAGVVKPPPIGILAGGSGNDLARSLGLPRAHDDALRTALNGDDAALDIARAVGPAGERYFASAGGIGFDAQVAAAMAGHRHRWQRGALGYLLSTLNELRRFRNQVVRITLDHGDSIERTVLFVAITNGAYYGGGMQICPSASTHDGMLDLCMVGDLSRLEAVRQIPGLYRGRHITHPAVTMLRARHIRIEGEPTTRCHLDGEPYGILPLTIEVLPGMLRVATAGPAR